MEKEEAGETSTGAHCEEGKIIVGHTHTHTHILNAAECLRQLFSPYTLQYNM